MFAIITENNYNSIMAFPAWSGGAQTLDIVREKGLEAELHQSRKPSLTIGYGTRFIPRTQKKKKKKKSKADNNIRDQKKITPFQNGTGQN